MRLQVIIVFSVVMLVSCGGGGGTEGDAIIIAPPDATQDLGDVSGDVLSDLPGDLQPLDIVTDHTDDIPGDAPMDTLMDTEPETAMDTDIGEECPPDVDPCVACEADEDCEDVFDDLAICEVAVCSTEYSACVIGPADEGASCEDEDPCNGLETCADVGGTIECVTGVALECGNGDPCDGEETCVAGVGCEGGEPLACDDGDLCNGEETCVPGDGCTDGEPLICSDGDPCNGEEGCDAADGCTTGVALECDDGDTCNGLETCVVDVGCESGEPLDCDDGFSCTMDACDPSEGCFNIPDHPVCDDQVDCTTDSCSTETGCENTPSDVFCDDESICTTEVCDGTDGCLYSSAQEGVVCGAPDEACDNGVCTPTGMVGVLAGAYLMGCNEATDTDCSVDGSELPYHAVWVPGFRIDLTETTVESYGDCVTAGACTAPGTGGKCNWEVVGRDDHPVNCVDWFQATDFCTWSGKRLCSESEWEKAARGTDGRIYPWGDDAPTCEFAVFNDGSFGCGVGTTWAVGSKPAGASPYGAMDMAGNVYEWVGDCWHDNYTSAPLDGSVWSVNCLMNFKMDRGGSFANFPTEIRASHRSGAPDNVAYDFLGFRCCSSD